jgi:hypothetical protein
MLNRLNEWKYDWLVTCQNKLALISSLVSQTMLSQSSDLNGAEKPNSFPHSMWNFRRLDSFALFQTSPLSFSRWICGLTSRIGLRRIFRIAVRCLCFPHRVLIGGSCATISIKVQTYTCLTITRKERAVTIACILFEERDVNQSDLAAFFN